ncbi:hypothetical protein MtrunA17_Chr5g0417731 [Medicago truncatula]|uniref:Transmembrane protein n=2 Tax=Medicago truncatula TaxID=3880 RepID=A0A396HU14_MEDTR|nr:hypothetical protein MtrunA17_Chr5g0417731 [Medicago truncatula]
MDLISQFSSFSTCDFFFSRKNLCGYRHWIRPQADMNGGKVTKFFKEKKCTHPNIFKSDFYLFQCQISCFFSLSLPSSQSRLYFSLPFILSSISINNFKFLENSFFHFKLFDRKSKAKISGNNVQVYFLHHVSDRYDSVLKVKIAFLFSLIVFSLINFIIK